MTTELTSHWRALYDNKYLGAWNLWQAEKRRYITATVVIESARFEEIVMQGGRKNNALLLRFRGKRTPLIVTKTMGKTLEKMHGKTPGEWIGHEITLYVEQGFKTREGPADVLRIKNTKAGADMKQQLQEQQAVEPERFEDAGERMPGEEG